MSLTCIIVDDEPNAVKLLELHIRETTGWQVLATCFNALEALECLRQHTADLIFLDINMPGLNGMELAALLPPGVKIVFTTAYSEYAAASYNFQTVDYLLKPITLSRFLAARQKIEASFRPPVPPSAAERIPEKDYFFVKSGKTLQRIALQDLLYFEGEKEYVRVVTTKGELLAYKRMKEIAEQLGPPFIRVHNSYIINSSQIEKIQDNHIYISGKRIPLSEKFRPDFMALIQQRSL
ncbi:LytR/AlgR family response regulator transcription factor [Chitinophaga nivalis]|uniref:LytTR family DNA-binding domain-containing protein n=1 Tax=Chitinophaga nivalis TaxID=2991709 RepID=A0ABT3IMJ7_9BACT|nr:LytTR family DNA-binding domain-containing protein [Chitinophaga nivalis]MCW3465303.1 LytTR family DNA-binding domain-containing protein [Chitinophaga nivalis]MCW3485005.1 LytTR family DNA-binding domain-containing protein [Chitinophaga nivalis]